MHKYVCTHAISDSGQRYRCPLSLARAWSAQQSPHHSHHSLNTHHTHHTRRISFGSAFGSTFWTTATSVPQHAGNLLTGTGCPNSGYHLHLQRLQVWACGNVTENTHQLRVLQLLRTVSFSFVPALYLSTLHLSVKEHEGTWRRKGYKQEIQNWYSIKFPYTISFLHNIQSLF